MQFALYEITEDGDELWGELRIEGTEYTLMPIDGEPISATEPYPIMGESNGGETITLVGPEDDDYLEALIAQLSRNNFHISPDATETRHLAGKHDQKKHGRSSGIGKSSLESSWMLENGEDGPQKTWVEQGVAKVTVVPTSSVIVESYDSKRVDLYKEKFKAGEKFPMPQGYEVGEKVQITAGHHRAAAWIALGHREIPVVVGT